jgi:thymidylate synthase (FAD)
MDYDDFDEFVWKEQSRLHRKAYHNWRNQVLKKYDYTCQKTGVKGGRLNVHHIIPWNENEDLRFDVNNGIVLSEESHIEFHKKYGYRNCTTENLKEFLEDKDDKQRD